MSALGLKHGLLALCLTGAAGLACGLGSVPGLAGGGEVALSRGQGAFDLADPATGLDGQRSYSADLTIGFEGTQGGQPNTWSQSYHLDVVREPWASRYVVSSDGLPEGGLKSATDVVVGGTAYTLRPDAPCAATPVEVDAAALALPTLASQLPQVLGAEETGQETVNGVPAVHYIFDERAIGAEGLSVATGNLWVAAEGGFVVRYTLEENGPMGYYGEDIEGTATWTYDLTAADQPIEIAPPPECLTGALAAPLPPDATGTASLPGFLSYTTTLVVEDVVAFYGEQLPAAGWQPEGEPVVGTGVAWWAFTQGEQRLSIQAVTVEAGTAVSIWLEGGSQ